MPAFAFAERGRKPQIPGPLIRVPQGTELRLTLTNRTDSTLLIGGLRPGVATSLDTVNFAPGSLLGTTMELWTRSTTPDTVHLAPGATRELRYRLDTPGTYFYWGTFSRAWREGAPVGGSLGIGTPVGPYREWLDSQLNGAIVVDPPGGSPPDRVFVISEWFLDHPDRPFEAALVINGKGWPHTERLTLPQGDSVRFRVVNAVGLLWHPMHLHGFYYRVTARGTWERDRPIPPALQPVVNTDLLPPGGTLTLAFLPTTPGNWLFHCHFASHMDGDVSLAGAPHEPLLGVASAAASHATGHASEPDASAAAGHAMRGLVLGLHVTPTPGYRPPRMDDPRELRLLAQKAPGALFNGGAAAYGFVLQDGDRVPPRDAVQIPGPVLELERGRPVRMTVVNNLDEPTGVHWHGLEIESFPDGVPNWSGMGDRPRTDRGRHLDLPGTHGAATTGGDRGVGIAGGLSHLARHRGGALPALPMVCRGEGAPARCMAELSVTRQATVCARTRRLPPARWSPPPSRA